MRITSTNITELKKNEVFVFGSNMKGVHGKGAAKDAVQWGAKYSIGEGLQGQTYAIPTKNEELKKLKLNEIQKHVEKFKNVVISKKNLIFLITPIGCGLAGNCPSDIAPLFKDFLEFENVYLPKEFIDILI